MSSQADISLYWLSDVPNLQNSIAVVSDVYAATSNISYILSQNPKRLVVVNEENIDKAKEEYGGALIVGESTILSESYFDVSNKPSDLRIADFQNREVIFITDNGTRAIEKAFENGASEVVTVSFNNFSAVKKYLENKQNSVVLIASGDQSKENSKAMEDWYCIETLKNSLEKKAVNLEETTKDAQRFALEYYQDEEQLVKDMALVFEVDTIDLVARATFEDFISISRV